MAKAKQKKPAAQGKKSAVKKVAAKVKTAAKSLKKKVAPKKAAKPAPKKPAAKKPAPKPVKKVAAKVKKAVAKVAKRTGGLQSAVARPKPGATPPTPKAVPPPKAKAPVATPPPPPARPAAAETEKKRGRRARPRIHSSGAPAAAWLSTEKPRPASFIPAPPRAEAPSAVAAPPASSDRLIRPEDVDQLSVRTVPVRIDVEQGPGRFYVIASPVEVTVRVTEGIEWDFRYIGGADVTVDEIIIEFERPSPFSQSVFKTRKPGGARPHRQLSGGAAAHAAGKRIQYTVRAMNMFKTEVARTNSIWMTVTP